MPLLVEAVLARYLSVAPVREFLLRRSPEGHLSNATLESCITFSYAGDGSSPKVKAPVVRDSFVVQSVVDGFALGEVLTCSFMHPLLPTLNSVSGSPDEVSTSAVTSRRFAADLLAPNTVEVLEFAWLEDARLIVSFRWTRLTADAPFVIEGETRLYPESVPGQELTMLWDVPLIRMSIYGQLCRECGASHSSECSCDPCVVPMRTVAEPSADILYGSEMFSQPPSLVSADSASDAQLVPRAAVTWSAFRDAMRSCRKMGSLRAVYRKGLPITPGSTRRLSEIVVSDGIAPYGISFSTGTSDEGGLKLQIQIYMACAQALFNLVQEPSKSAAEEDALLLLEYPSSQSAGRCEASKSARRCFATMAEEDDTDEVGEIPWFDDEDDEEEIYAKQLFGDWDPSSGSRVDDSDPPMNSERNLDSQSSYLASSDNASGTGGHYRRRGNSSSNEGGERDEALLRGASGSGSSSNTMCSACGAKFTRPANLKRHYNTIHLKLRSKQHMCPKCDRSFFNTVELKRHMAKHEKPRPQCPQCGTRFRLASALELHVSVVHGQERPFKCESCGAAFARKSALLRHVKSVHHRERYTCDECDASYSQPFDLKMHKRRAGHGSGDDAMDECFESSACADAGSSIVKQAEET